MEFELPFLIALTFAVESSSNNFDGLIEFDDVELEEDISRRWIGGPWSPEETLSILNTAIGLMSKSDGTRRQRKFDLEARQLLQTITAEEDPRLPTAAKDDEIDEDYIDEPITVNERQIAPTTAQKIADMHDGTNGQKRRSLDGISKIFPWFQPYMIPHFRGRLLGARRAKLRAVEEFVVRVFTAARNNRQPVHGRMLYKWARQAANETGLDDSQASDNWLAKFKRRQKIVSRKVTVYKSRSEEQNRDNVAASMLNFSRLYSEESSNLDQGDIWIFDLTVLHTSQLTYGH